MYITNIVVIPCGFVPGVCTSITNIGSCTFILLVVLVCNIDAQYVELVGGFIGIDSRQFGYKPMHTWCTLDTHIVNTGDLQTETIHLRCFTVITFLAIIRPISLFLSLQLTFLLSQSGCYRRETRVRFCPGSNLWSKVV